MLSFYSYVHFRTYLPIHAFLWCGETCMYIILLLKHLCFISLFLLNQTFLWMQSKGVVAVLTQTRQDIIYLKPFMRKHRFVIFLTKCERGPNNSSYSVSDFFFLCILGGNIVLFSITGIRATSMIWKKKKKKGKTSIP